MKLIVGNYKTFQVDLFVFAFPFSFANSVVLLNEIQ